MKELSGQINQLIKANKELFESNKKLANHMEAFFEEKKALEESKQNDPKLNKLWQLFKKKN